LRPAKRRSRQHYHLVCVRPPLPILGWITCHSPRSAAGGTTTSSVSSTPIPCLDGLHVTRQGAQRTAPQPRPVAAGPPIRSASGPDSPASPSAPAIPPRAPALDLPQQPHRQIAR